MAEDDDEAVDDRCGSGGAHHGHSFREQSLSHIADQDAPTSFRPDGGGVLNGSACMVKGDGSLRPRIPEAARMTTFWPPRNFSDGPRRAANPGRQGAREVASFHRACSRWR
jgi:hypothetical protein